MDADLVKKSRHKLLAVQFQLSDSLISAILLLIEAV